MVNWHPIRRATSPAWSRRWWRRSRRRTSSCGLRWNLSQTQTKTKEKTKTKTGGFSLRYLWLHQERGHDIILRHLNYKTDWKLFSMWKRKLVELTRWNGLSNILIFVHKWSKLFVLLKVSKIYRIMSTPERPILVIKLCALSTQFKIHEDHLKLCQSLCFFICMLHGWSCQFLHCRVFVFNSCSNSLSVLSYSWVWRAANSFLQAVLMFQVL